MIPIFFLFLSRYVSVPYCAVLCCVLILQYLYATTAQQRGLASAASSVGVSIRQKGGDEPGSGHLSQLALLLISRACENDEVANFLFWYLKLEAEVRGRP